MRTKRDEALERAAKTSIRIDDAIAEVRTSAGEALRHPLRKGSATDLFIAVVLLPLMGIAATMADTLPDMIRRSRDPELDEPASNDSGDGLAASDAPETQ